MASLCLTALLLTAFVCDVVSVTESVPGDNIVKITNLGFNSANSVRVQWRYWSLRDTGDVPRTQIDVLQNTSVCGENAPIETLDISMTTSMGTKELIVWNQDSRYPVTACVRIMADQQWQAWDSIRIRASYRSPPYFTVHPKQPENLMSRDKSMRSVFVKYGGSPVPRWAWVINGHKYDHTGPVGHTATVQVEVISGQKLVLERHHNIREDLEIWAEISNPYSTVRSEKLTVKRPYFEPSDCNSMNLDYKVVVNYTAGAILSCSAVDSSYPEVIHTWRFCPGRHCRSLSESGRLSQCHQIHFDDRILEGSNGEKLVFTHAYPSDHGCYVCESEHSILMESCLSTTNLDQMGHEFDFRVKLLTQVPRVILQPDGHSEVTSVNVGGKLILECAFQGRPSPDIVWKQEDRLIIEDARHTLSQHNMVLTISDAQRLDEGQYTCTGTNTYGSDTGRFLLAVREIPVIKVLNPQSGPVGENITLFCEVQPLSSRISWFKNEDILDTMSGFEISGDGSRLTLINVQLNDSASYGCEATNSYGAAKASVPVVVHERLTIWNIEGKKLPEIAPGYQRHMLYCNASTDPNLQLHIEWNINAIESYACKQKHVVSNITDFPNVMTLSIKQVCQVRVTCVANSGGQEACSLWRAGHKSVPCDQETRITSYKYLNLILGTTGLSVVIVLGSAVMIVRFRK